MDRQTVAIRLELHPDDDSVSGRASDAAGAVQEFVGWMGLVAAIDALLPGSPPALGAISTPDEGDSS